MYALCYAVANTAVPAVASVRRGVLRRRMGNQETVEFSMSTATKTSRPEARSGAPKISPQAVVLLVDDQPIVAEALRRVLADVPDITVEQAEAFGAVQTTRRGRIRKDTE